MGSNKKQSANIGSLEDFLEHRHDFILEYDVVHFPRTAKQ